MEKPYWEGKHYAFFSNKECEYFPCHAGADPENFNCLFCYCPLYALGDKCGGNFRMTETGIKDCTNCQLPHKAQNYGYVTGKYSELAELMKKIREEKDGLSAELGKAFGSIGINIEDANGDLRSTYDILSDYAKVYPKLTSEQRQYFGELAAGKRQITVFNAIVDEMSAVDKAIE